MRRTGLLLAVMFALISNIISAQTFNYDAIAPHPRLFLGKGEEQKIKKLISVNPDMLKVHQRIIHQCDSIIPLAPLERIKSGKRLLGVSRMVLERVLRLSYAYRMTGEAKYAARAEKEMLKASSFSDWNITHFLDVGEMTLALAIGYDWLYDYLPESSKKSIAEAVTEKAFDPTKTVKFFYTLKNNWNSVCNGGLVAGALALYEYNPSRSQQLIEESVAGNPNALECYGPDGCYPEGYTYWSYGTSYQIVLIEALKTALGDDNGLSKAQGFMESARYMQFMSTPTSHCFAYSDSTVGANSNLMLYWFAKTMGDISVLWSQIPYLKDQSVGVDGEERRFLPFLLVFASQIDFKDAENIAAPSSNIWKSKGHTPLFIYRGGWSGSNDTYLGIKGGTASASHGHMDAGSFVYEKDGERWSVDLGRQEYLSLESKGVDLWNMKQNSGRWNVFRLSTQAHSTMMINDKPHLVKGFADITETFTSEKCKGAKLDMTSLYGDAIEKATRSITLDKKDNLKVVDIITTNEKEAKISWIMTTMASAKITGKNEIELTKNGKKMVLKVSSKSPVKMKILSTVSDNDYDHPNKGSLRVGFDAELATNSSTTFTISLR